MGLIDGVMSLVFGGGANAVRETMQVFRENTEAGAERSAELQKQAMQQYGAEFAAPRKGWFDQVMDAINRVPRPALALGTLGLFVSAMVSPLWFAERMQGIALVPEPLWWLLGVIVSFYFGARHQVKAQQFQRDIAQRMGAVPQVIENIRALRRLGAATPGVADTGTDADLSVASIEPEANAALDAWRRVA